MEKIFKKNVIRIVIRKGYGKIHCTSVQIYQNRLVFVLNCA